MAKRTKRAAARKTKSKGAKARGKALRKKAAKRAAPKRAKKTVRKTVKKRAGARRTGAASKTRTRQQQEMLKPSVGEIETTIVDVIEEPLPGVVTVTEFEAARIVLPDTDEESES